MTPSEKKSYIRLIYSRAFRYLGVCLALSAIVGGLYQDMLYTVYALCAFGMVMICWGWFTYLRSTGTRIFGRNPDGKARKTPYILRRFKDKKPARPSFRMTSADFDDDLTSATAVNEEPFTKLQTTRARIIARVACGALLVVISLIINI